VHADLAGLDLSGGGPLFETTGRNTAAAIASATLRTLSEFGDNLMPIAPYDHEIATGHRRQSSPRTRRARSRHGRS
ncbi:MAG: hypothetical protein E5V25_10135, partial [Mesorhizobium sp.]